MQLKIVALAAAALLASPAIAATPTAAPASNAAAAKKPVPPVVRTAKSLDCSKQADGKGLHGKARKGFMSTCKKA